MLSRAVASLGAVAVLPLLANASDQFSITPASQDVCVGTDLKMDLCTRPGDFTVLLVSKVPGQTIIPGIGTFDIPLSPFPTILELGMAPPDGCFHIKKMVPCNCDALDYYLQGVSLNPLDMTFEISNPAHITVKTLCQDWDGDGINDVCDPDCDGDGVIDGLELDSDGDGIPNDCDEICEKPKKACDDGCWKLFNKPLSSGGPVGDYGFRMDGLFGDHSDNMYTFSFEWPGTDVQMCHDDSADTLTLKGIVYGGLGLAPAWDPAVEGYALLDFTWTGAKCKDGKLRVKKDGGTGVGSFTWLNTGEVIPLGPKADADDIYAYIDTDLLFHAWVSFPGMPAECCQDFKASAVGITSCP
jgi:hypothetical protein